MGMRRRVKPSIIYISIVIILATCILIICNNIFNLLSDKETINSKVDIEMMPITELIIKSCKIGRAHV